MKRTMFSKSQLILQEEQAFARVRQKLQPAEQALLDELLNDLKLLTIQLQDSGRTPDFELILLVLLLVQYRDLKWLWEEVHELESKNKANLVCREAHLSRSIPVDPGFGFDDDPQD